MIFRIVAILEPYSSTNPTDDDVKFQVNARPIVCRPVYLVGCLDEDFDSAWYNSISFNSEDRALSVWILYGYVFYPDYARRLARELHRLTFDFSERLVSIKID